MCLVYSSIKLKAYGVACKRPCMCKMFKAVYPIEKRGGVSNSKNCCIVYFLKVIPVTGDRVIVLVLRGEFGLAKKPRLPLVSSRSITHSFFCRYIKRHMSHLHMSFFCASEPHIIQSLHDFKFFIKPFFLAFFNVFS